MICFEFWKVLKIGSIPKIVIQADGAIKTTKTNANVTTTAMSN
jgi:hypothetical protein